MNILVPTEVLDRLMPMHLLLGADFRIAHAGPTLRKLSGGVALVGRPLLEVFDIGGAGPKKLDQTGRRSFALSLRHGHRTRLRGVLFDLGTAAGGGAILNLSFNVNEFERLDSAGLTLDDFAANDLIADILYLIEANTAVKAEARRLIRRLQGQASSATELAVTDTLTGLKNRRALERAMARLVDRGTPFAVMQLDLDLFKAVNDTYGHAAGDAVLVHVAEALTRATRKSDTVARVGGDEFVILLAGETDHDRIAQVARRIIALGRDPGALR